MPIRLNCPNCGQLLQVADDAAGKLIRCPGCQETSRCPLPAGEPISDLAAAPLPDDSIADDRSQAPFNPYASPQLTDDPFVPGMQSVDGSYDLQHSTFDAMEVLTTAWSLFKRNAPLLFGAGLIVILITMGGEGLTRVFENELEANPTPGVWAAYLLSSICSSLIQLFIGIGVLKINLAVARGQPTEIGVLFSGASHFWPVLGTTLIFWFAVLFGLVLLIIPGLFLAVALWPAKYFIVDRNVPAIESLSVAWNYTRDNRLNAFGLAVLSVLLVIVGFLMLCVGLFLVLPIIWLSWTVAYLRMTGQPVARPN